MKVKSLGYIGIESNKMDEWQSYCTNVLGLMEMEAPDNELRFRMDDLHWRIAVSRGDKEDLIYAGFDTRDSDRLNALVEQLATLGFKASEDAALATSRGVSCLYKVADPDGLQVELFYGATEIAEIPFISPAGVSGFLTGDQGLGHIVLYTGDIEEKRRFYMQGLGFKLSDTILMGGEVMLTFLHCNPRHHTVALVPAPVPKRMNHFMVQANTLDDVGHANDRAQRLGAPITVSLGCHTNDRMVSFYSRSPSDFEVEFGFGARVVDDKWSVGHHTGPSIWGHKAVTQDQ